MNENLDTNISVLSSAERIERARKIAGFTQQMMVDKIGILKLRSIQNILKTNMLLKPRIYAHLSQIFNIPEYQFFGELPTTYIFQCRKISNPTVFADILQKQNIIDVKWNFQEISQDKKGYIRSILDEIDKSYVSKYPIKNYHRFKQDAYSKLDYLEIFDIYEERKSLFQEITKGSDSISIFFIPVFCVVPIKKPAPTFVWQEGVIIHLLPNEFQEKNMLPTFVDYVGDENHIIDQEYSDLDYDDYSSEALNCRPDLNNLERINLGDTSSLE